MAHIPDGVLSIPVLAVGAVVSMTGVGLGLRGLEPVRAPRVAVLSAVLFLASLVHFPVGLSSVHLLLNGLAGMVLGWAVFPAMLVALLLQSLLFGFGGLLSLGVNCMDMALPGLLAGAFFRLAWKKGSSRRAAVAGGMAAAGSVALTVGMISLALALSGREFAAAAKLILVAHLPVMAVEAVFTAAAASLLARVKPEMLERPA